MRLLPTLLLAAGGVAYYRHRKRATSSTLDDSLGVMPESSVREMATSSGISDVDPAALSTIGEAQDPDAIENAHTELADLHDRLPR